MWWCVQMLACWTDRIYLNMMQVRLLIPGVNGAGEATIPETWSMSLVEWTAHRLMRYPDEEGSDGKRACSWAYSSCKSKMGKTAVYIYNGCKINEILKPQPPPCAACTPLICSFSAPLSSFWLSISWRHSPALSEEDLEAIRAALRYGQLKAVVSHTPDDGRWVHVFIRDLSC